MKKFFCKFLRDQKTFYVLDELVLSIHETVFPYFVYHMNNFNVKNYEINVVDGEIQIYMNDILKEIGIEPDEILELKD